MKKGSIVPLVGGSKGKGKTKSTKAAAQSSPKSKLAAEEPLTIGLDLGDKTSRYCVLGSNGE